MNNDTFISRQLRSRLRKQAIVGTTIALVIFLGIASLSIAKDGDKPRGHLDMTAHVVRSMLNRFANNPQTVAKDVRELLEYDLEAGLYVIRARSILSDDLMESAGYLAGLQKIDDLQAVAIAEIYFQWEGKRPKAFHMSTHDPVRNRMLTKMLLQVKGDEARKKVQEFIDNLRAERFENNNPIPDQLKPKSGG